MSPVTPSAALPTTDTIPTTDAPLRRVLNNEELDAMLNQIRLDMEALHTRDQAIDQHQDRLDLRIDVLEASDAALTTTLQELRDEQREALDSHRDAYAQELEAQRTLLSKFVVQVDGMVRYLRDERAGNATTSTPPSFNPPPFHTPGTPMFPELGQSIST